MAKLSRHVPALAQIFHIMGDETRLSVLMALQKGERNVTSLVKQLKMPQSTVSHHLALMRMVGLVTTRRSGKEIFYSINGEEISSQKALQAMLKRSAGMKMGKLVFGLVGK